ncbi:MFS transporter [Aspergillus mulundensis]|uniref:MFS transporter n=1 Tax=Aspergillus mulundensis TaxID=1810919 RepID=A0A3D8QRW5_9EURO|nr:MFS transporter [Aspergillus mulundensis]RDW64418.1 MFS transporter [Aspergillus mulundensis]
MSDSEPPERLGEATEENEHNTNEQVSQHGKAGQPSLWKRLAPNIPLVIMMFKGSLPMTISLAIYQSGLIANRYTTVGYIMAMIAFFSMALLPRAKYLEGLVLNILATCLGSALSLLTMYCGVKAREHTTAPGSTASYNSSQSAVCAIWFFCTQWAAGTVRARIPLLQNCVYMFSVMTMITMTYAPRFHTMDQAISLVVELLEIFFIAFAIATGVSLFVFPMTTRTILFRRQTAYFGALRDFMTKQTAYYRALGASAPPGSGQMFGRTDADRKKSFREREALYGSLNRLIALHMEMYTDTISAKREIAFGKLDADDLHQLFRVFRSILTPMAGIKTILQALDGMDPGYPTDQPGVREKAVQDQALRDLWSQVMAEVGELSTDIAQVIDEGWQHAAIVLEYMPKPSKDSDLECQRLGSPTFADYMDRKIQAFRGRRSEFLSTWAKDQERMSEGEHGLIYLVLQVENLISSIAVAVHQLVLFADSKVRDGTMARKRFVFPRLRHFTTHLRHPTIPLDETSTPDADLTESGILGMVARSKANDYHHLPPSNAWQRWTNHLRAVPRLLRSKESAFGLRIALAAFSVGILAYLEQTWTFYYQQRLIWPLIVILVAMNVASGESTFKLAAQVIGATAAMIICFLCWYIVDGKPAGVLVLTWLAFFALSYGFIRVPKFFAVWLCVLVPIVAVIGIALQSQKLGHETVVASGQADYPVYLSAPYRLLNVLAGSFIAYVWTVFPYPITDRGLLGEKLGDVLCLLAQYQDCAHSITSLKLRGGRGKGDDAALAFRSSPGGTLDGAQQRLFQRIMTLIPPLRMHALFQKFDLPIGGEYPVSKYTAIMQEATSIMNSINLLIHSSTSWPPLPQSPATSTVLDSVSTHSHQMTSALLILSASVKHGTPLPPYFQAPPAVDFSPLWQELPVSLDALSGEKEKSEAAAVHRACAMMQMVSDMSNAALARMVVQVRDLVGEVNFAVGVKE